MTVLGSYSGMFHSMKNCSVFLHAKILLPDFLSLTNNMVLNRPNVLCKTIGYSRLFNSLSETMEEKKFMTLQFSELLQPVEYKDAAKRMTSLQHQINYKLLSEIVCLPHQDLALFKTHLEKMVSDEPNTNTMETDRIAVPPEVEEFIITNLLEACTRCTNVDLYFSVVHLIERSVREPIDVRLLAKCVECMAERGWCELGKRNIRSVFDGGSMLNSFAILKLMQVYVRQKDFKFAVELTVVLKQSMTTLSAIEVSKSCGNLIHLLIKEILDIEHGGKERQELIKELLFLYQRDEGPEGWSKERAENVVQLLQQSGEYSIKTLLLHSSGTCLNCLTELLYTGITIEDQARLRLSVYRKIRQLEMNKGIGSPCPSSVTKLVKIIRNKDYGLVVDGLNIVYWCNENKDMKPDLMSSIRTATRKRKLVILREHLRNKSGNLFKNESDFDVVKPTTLTTIPITTPEHSLT